MTFHSKIKAVACRILGTPEADPYSLLSPPGLYADKPGIFFVNTNWKKWLVWNGRYSKNGVSYDSRRVYGESQVFVFRAEKEGDYTLAFYKQDFLRDYVTNEYARVLVTDEPPPVETAALPEAAPPARDILSALDAYSSIIRDYPQSKYYKNAQNRIAFLNKFYLNIR
jgi:hypothetical protein